LQTTESNLLPSFDVLPEMYKAMIHMYSCYVHYTYPTHYFLYMCVNLLIFLYKCTLFLQHIWSNILRRNLRITDMGIRAYFKKQNSYV